MSLLLFRFCNQVNCSYAFSKHTCMLCQVRQLKSVIFSMCSIQALNYVPTIWDRNFFLAESSTPFVYQSSIFSSLKLLIEFYPDLSNIGIYLKITKNLKYGTPYPGIDQNSNSSTLLIHRPIDPFQKWEWLKSLACELLDECLLK